MSYWKTLGGVAVGTLAGVGSVALLPVLGPIGAVTAVGAGVGMGVGAVFGGGAGAFMDNADASESRQREAAEKALARATRASEELARRLAEAAQRFRSYAKFDQFIVTLAAVGFSVASMNGGVEDLAFRDIVEFVAGISNSVLPETVKQVISELAVSPPSFNTAMSYLDKLDPGRSDKALAELVEAVIEVASMPSGHMSEAGLAWRSAWHGYRAA